MEFKMTIDTKYASKLNKELSEKHNKIFDGRIKDLSLTIDSMKWWYRQMPKVSCHCADLNPKTAARYYVCAAYIHELIRYLHLISKFGTACELYDIDDIIKVEFLIPDRQSLMDEKYIKRHK